MQVSRVLGDFDFLVNGTFSHSDGFREHSVSDYTKINGNFGYRFSPNVETRFYFGVYDTWQQLPGTLTLSETLNNPTLSTAPWIAGYGPNGFEGNQARDVKISAFQTRRRSKPIMVALSSTAGSCTMTSIIPCS